MKLENHVTVIPRGEDHEGPASYADLLTILVNSSAMKGITVEVMRINLAILDKCEEVPVFVGDIDDGTAAVSLEFNSAETAHIRKIVAAHQWSTNHRDIVEFVDAITKADE